MLKIKIPLQMSTSTPFIEITDWFKNKYFVLTKIPQKFLSDISIINSLSEECL